MQHIKLFDFNGYSLNVYGDAENPMFLGREVADILEYRTASDALRILDEDEKTLRIICVSGQDRQVNMITESGLYSLILRSTKPEAKTFKRWVTAELLPSIRKHGAYMTPATIENVIGDPEAFAKLALALAGERKEKEQAKAQLADATQEIAVYKPKALFADAVNASTTCIGVGELAKIIKQNGIDTGEKRLFIWMRSNGFMMRRGKMNIPTQYAMNLGLFEMKETPIIHNNGTTSINITPKVTGKGQTYFITKFFQEKRA